MATERVLNEYCSTIAAPGVSSAQWGDNIVGARLTQVAFKD